MAIGAHTYHFSGSGEIGIANTSTTVATNSPEPGFYVVNATAAGIKNNSGGYLVCRTMVVNGAGTVFSATPYGYNNTAFTIGTMAEGGVVSVLPGSTIQERCLTNVSASGGAGVWTATIDAVKIDGTTAGPMGSHHKIPANTFVTHKALKGGKDRPGAK